LAPPAGLREDARSPDADLCEEVTMQLLRTSDPAVVIGRARIGTFTARP
jgi:hypothetical protein